MPETLETLLRGVSTSDRVRAAAWDAFHESATADELATRLRDLQLPRETKAAIWDLKQSGGTSSPAPPPQTRGPDWSMAPSVGGMGLGIAGLALGGPLGAIAGAALGGGLGEAGRLLNQSTERPVNPADALMRLLVEAGKQGGLETVGGLTSQGMAGIGRILLNRAVAPTTTLSREFPDIMETIERERLPVGRSLFGSVPGSERATQAMGASRADALRRVSEAEHSLPRVAGYLPPAREDLPLGIAPVPEGGRLAAPLAKAGEFRAQLSVPRLQGLNPDNPLDPIFHGTTRSAAPVSIGDVVEGPGAMVRAIPLERGGVSGAVVGAPPTMVAPKEIAAPVGVVRDTLGARALDRQAQAELDGLLARFYATHDRPLSLTQTQALKEAEQGLAERAYRLRDRGGSVNEIELQFHEAIASGAQRALEGRVNGLAEVNQRTQGLIGAQKALTAAETRRLSLAAEGISGAAGVIGAMVGTGNDYGGYGQSSTADRLRNATIAWAVARGLGSPRSLSRFGLRLTSRQAATAMRQIPRLAEFVLSEMGGEQPQEP